MKKFASIVILGSVLSFTALQAKAQADSMQNIVMTQKVASVSQDDMNMLFDNVDRNEVVALSETEMSETKGEFFDGLLVSLGAGAIVSLVSWSLSCIIDGNCTDFNYSFTTDF